MVDGLARLASGAFSSVEVEITSYHVMALSAAGAAASISYLFWRGVSDYQVPAQVAMETGRVAFNTRGFDGSDPGLRKLIFQITKRPQKRWSLRLPPQGRDRQELVGILDRWRSGDERAKRTETSRFNKFLG